MKKKTYIICPVRNANAKQKKLLEQLTAQLEKDGFEVHYPARDVDQTNDDGGVRICYEHREAMLDCTHVHIVWDDESKGSHFDLGMAYMMSAFAEVVFVSPATNPVVDKSFQNVVHRLHHLSRKAVAHEDARPADLDRDSGDRFLTLLDKIAREDAQGLKTAARSYGNSWKSRGGVGAFMMLARKWDRLQNRLGKLAGRVWDIFHGIATDDRGEGLIDDVRDLRRYLMLVEAEMRARGFNRHHRDNLSGTKDGEKVLEAGRALIEHARELGYKIGDTNEDTMLGTLAEAYRQK